MQLLDLLAVLHDAPPRAHLHIFGGGAKSWQDVLLRALEVRSRHLEFFHVDGLDVVDLHLAREGIRGRRLHQTLNLGARKVLRLRGEHLQVDVFSEVVALAHTLRVNVQDLDAARLVGQRYLDVHLETTGPQQRIVDHILPVRHPDEQDVVQRIDSIDLREHLVDDGVAYARATGAAGAALLAD